MPVRELACDESGYEGEKLVGGETDVFAHAGVLLGVVAAAGCVTELRRRIRSPALEYKANHLLREKNRGALEWFLGPAGPIHGRAHVYLVDKTFLLVSRIAEADPAALDGDLLAANDRLRGLQDGEPRLDLLGPAILRAAARWGGDGPVAIVHDRQTALNDHRVARLKERSGGRLADLTFVDSRTDPRVQLADFLAGVARKVASYALAGRGDAELVALLRPYVDPASVWGDDRSWSELTARSSDRPAAT